MMQATANAAGGSSDATAGKIVDLRDMIDKTGCYARNVSSGFPMDNLFIGDSRLGCKSDADEQLILHITFNQFVKVRMIQERTVDIHKATDFFLCFCTSLLLDSIHQTHRIQHGI